MDLVVLYINLILLYICKAECDMAKDFFGDYETSMSIDSMSNEIVNNVLSKPVPTVWAALPSKKDKPQRLNTIDVKSNNLHEKVTTTTEEIPKVYNITLNSCSAVSTKEELAKCKTTLISYPFSVSIQRKGSHYTSGALIDAKRILSSAGDFYTVRETIKLFKARLGSVNCKKGGILKSIKRIDLHILYQPGKPTYDISLLTLANPVTFTDYIQPIAMSKIKANVLSAKFLTTYWPRIVVGSMVLPNNAKERIKPNSMRVSSQKLMPSDQCQVILNKTSTQLDQSSLCLHPIASHHSACRPDAGAPMVADDGLWGITSGWISGDCSAVPSPTIFTRVSSADVRYWLDKKLAF